MKVRIFSAFLGCLILILSLPCFAIEYIDKSDAKELMLMEAETGTVLFEKNADQPLPPASVTKVMTILLVLEALDAGKIHAEDLVTVSDYACGMGGSQVYLKAGETMSVDDLLKSVVVSSANDAAVALAEYLSGTEESFVSLMNARAKELGMVNTVFKNTNGLDDSDEGHVTSARDIAIMTREVLKHERIFRYSTIWMDSIRDGAFGLTNTNRLIRFYKGANGLKTGSTSKAGFCISATAKRDDMQLIAVVMGAGTRDGRNAAAASLLDYGFGNYAVKRFPAGKTEPFEIIGGTEKSITGTYAGFSCVLDISDADTVTFQICPNPELCAPIAKGDCIGMVKYCIDDKTIGETEIYAEETVEKITFPFVFENMLKGIAAIF